VWVNVLSGGIMPLWGIIVIVILAIIVLIAISYAFRDSFFLFEGICVMCDAIGGGLSDGGDGCGD